VFPEMIWLCLLQTRKCDNFPSSLLTSAFLPKKKI
jgi:hypothetical protein